MQLGPVMLGLDGTELSTEERELLRHPRAGGVILFTRNYHSPAQLAALTRAIRSVRETLLIAVDQEGGRVQRFRDGFEPLPPPRRWGELYDVDPDEGLRLADAHAYLLAAELAAVDIDFSFAPVLDLDLGLNRVIADRALHADPDPATALALAFVTGLRRAGMAAVGKHFPGHGSVSADSHYDLPVDPRPLGAIEALDLRPFRALIQSGIDAIMPALIVYPEIDERPACFSHRWLTRILRRQLGFDGAIFSDDLGMAGAAYAGGALARAEAALAAGCDMVLACNERDAAVAMLDGLRVGPDAEAQPRLTAMRRRAAVNDRESGVCAALLRRHCAV